MNRRLALPARIAVACTLVFGVIGLASTALVAQQSRVGTEDLELGRTYGGAGVSFSYVSGIELDRAGRIYVADQDANNIQVFSPSGERVATWGRAGSGPGDLRLPCCIITDSLRSVLWILEGSSRGYTAFDLESGQYRHRVAGGTPRRANLMFSDEGRLILPVIDPVTRARAHVELDSAGTTHRVVTLVAEPPHDSLGRKVMEIDNVDRTAEYGVTHPFAPRELVGLSPDGWYARAMSSSYRISLFDQDGDLAEVIERPAEPIRVTADERRLAARALDSLTIAWRNFGGEYPDFDIPAVKPPLESMWFDRDGRLWVRLTTVADDEMARADVYDKAGTLLFRATWPADVSLGWGAIRGDTAIGIRTDRLDVHSVVRLRFTDG